MVVLAAGWLVSAASAGRIAVGEAGSCRITAGGGVVCWGTRGGGSLGDGLDRGFSYAPVGVKGLTSGVTDLTSSFTGGGSHSTTCAIAGGAVRCWGTNGSKLGDPKLRQSSSPLAIAGLESGVTALSSNASNVCAVQNGAAKCWGSTYGPVPVTQQGLDTGVTQVAVGWRHFCALKEEAGQSDLWCWGSGANQALAGGATTKVPVKTAIRSVVGTISKVVAGQDHTCVLAQGGVYCWGSSSVAGAGATVDQASPRTVPGLESGVTDIAADAQHVCAVKAGSVYCWGEGANGRVGDGAPIRAGVGKNLPTPVLVKGPTGVTAIAVGARHTCAIGAGDVTWCWGRNEWGQVGSEAAGGETSVATKQSGPLLPKVTPAGAAKPSGGKVTLATIGCPANGACTLTLPKSVTVRIGGTRQELPLVARTISPGRTGTVDATLSDAAAKALAGKTMTVKVSGTVVRNSQTLPLVFTASFKA